jgi:hypothetical protein
MSDLAGDSMRLKKRSGFSRPKAAAGKARSARNARRHGLSIPIRDDRELAEEAAALARRICGSSPSPKLSALANEIADAHFEIVRVRRARAEIVVDWNFANRINVGRDQIPADVSMSEFDTRLLKHAIETGAHRLKKIGRYEKRAFSRQNRAIEMFDAVNISENWHHD